MFKVGDRVVCKEMAIYDGTMNYYRNKSGVILNFYEGVYLVKFDDRFVNCLHSDDKKCWNFISCEFDKRFYPEEKYEKMMKEKEEKRLINILIDPFGEEIW